MVSFQLAAFTRIEFALLAQCGTIGSLNRERSLCLAFRRNLADWFQDFGNKILNSRAIGFHPQFPQNIPMRRRYRLYLLGIILLGCSFTLLADTPALLRSVPAGGWRTGEHTARPPSPCYILCP